MKVLILQGLPASGKSTIAKQLVKDDTSYTRVNKDDLRCMLYGRQYTKRSEKMVLAIRDSIIKEALERGQNVIVDDTNFNPRHIEAITSIADSFNAEVEVRLINTPVKECVKRNAERENPVPNVAIYGMHKQYLREVGK